MSLDEIAEHRSGYFDRGSAVDRLLKDPDYGPKLSAALAIVDTEDPDYYETATIHRWLVKKMAPARPPSESVLRAYRKRHYGG